MSRFSLYLFYSSVLFLLLGCKNHSKGIIVERDSVLTNVLSASACEQVDDMVFIVGDDSPYLCIADLSFHITDSILIFPSHKSRINKSIKHDYESIETVRWNGEKALLLLGSGASKNRRKALVVTLSNRKLFPIDLTHFFSTLSSQIGIDSSEINCEGLAVFKDKMILLNKPTNTLIETSWSAFKSFVKGQSSTIKFSSYKAILPARNQHELQFTGADFSSTGELYFTAYTDNGAKENQYYPKSRALFGTIDLGNLQKNFIPNCVELPSSISAKIEGITITGNHHNYQSIILVSDGENQSSKLFKLKWKLR